MPESSHREGSDTRTQTGGTPSLGESVGPAVADPASMVGEGQVLAWAPPEQDADQAGSIPIPSIVTVGRPDDRTLDIFGLLKASWLGRTYTGHLKKIPWVRGLVIWGWRTLYPLYAHYRAIRLSADHAGRWRHLTKLKRYVATHGSPSKQLLGAAQAATPRPRVFPAQDQAAVSPLQPHYDFPSIYVATISAANVYGGSNIVWLKDAALCHDLFDIQRDYTSEELHARHRMDAKRDRVRLLSHDKQPEHLPVAAVFIDACAHNYAHWLTEVLPRIAAFCAQDNVKRVPIIVDDGLHKNILESLFLVTGPEREIMTLPVGRGLLVDSLYVTSVAGYVPFDRRNETLGKHSEGKFNPHGLELMRQMIAAKAGHGERKSWPKKIYLRRNSGTRVVTNAAALEKLLVPRDFVVVETERLSFLEQVRLFENAQEIIGPTGAALANAIFCKPGTRLVVLMSKHEKMIYGYWLNMLAPLRIEVSYVLGVIDSKRHLGIHGDFTVSSRDLLDMLDSEKNP